MIKEKSDVFRVLNYKPLPKQEEFHKANNKFRGYLGGLGSGKTHSGVFEALYCALKYPKTLGFILAPTYRVLKDSTIRSFFKYCPEILIKEYNRSEQILTLINDSEILFRCCEDEKVIDRLRNVEIGWFWIDEARGVPEYAWKVLIGRLRQQNAPLIGWITSTTKGFNWIYKKFAEKPNPDYFYTVSSSTENTYLPKDYLNSLKNEYSGRYAEQEIEGKFVGFEGVVYEEFSRDTHVLRNHVVLKSDTLGFGIKEMED